MSNLRQRVVHLLLYQEQKNVVDVNVDVPGAGFVHKECSLWTKVESGKGWNGTGKR
ncbi:MAG: hypothetical protein LBV02_06380 [Bacteroidales bacterium]|jgi:hypothetical protein|nr:hypothetical protein [Bacteroidales bacterium]